MTLRAGAAAVDISPSGAVPLFGYPHAARISTGIHDPLWASALALDNGELSALLIALDLLMLDAATARALRCEAADSAGMAEERVFISCTHTHSGPVTARILPWQEDEAAVPPDPAYLDRLRREVLAAATAARAAMQPAEIAWTTADARGVGGNRLSAGGVTDREAGLCAVRAAGGGPLLATVMIYGMHPTVLHEDSTLVSSDFPHYARQELRERFGPSLTVLYQMAPAGDQSPRHFVRGQTFAEAERLGRGLGRAAAASLEKLLAGHFRGDCPLGGMLRKVTFPRRTVPPVDEARQILAEYHARHRRLVAEQAEAAEIRTAECAVFGAEGNLTLARLQQRGELEAALSDYQPMEIQALRLGDATLVGLPGEWFAEYALEIKRRGPGRAFVVTLVNGQLQGYVATAAAAAAGGYEALSAVFDAPAAGRLGMDVAQQLLAELLPPAARGLPRTDCEAAP
jgi:hypothetical protein